MFSDLGQFVGNRLVLLRDGPTRITRRSCLAPKPGRSLPLWWNQKAKYPRLSEKYFPLPLKSAFNFTDKYKRPRQPVCRPCKKEERRQKNKR